MLQSLIKGQTCLDLLGYFTRQCLGDSCRPWSRFFHVLKAQRCHVTFGAQVSTPCRRTLQKVRLPPGWVELIVHLVGLVFCVLLLQGWAALSFKTDNGRLAREAQREKGEVYKGHAVATCKSDETLRQMTFLCACV